MPNTTYGTPYVASSDLVSAYPGTSSTLATRIDDISLKGNGLNNQTGTAYTLVLTDGGKTVTLSNAAAVTVTIPANASVAFPLGTEINFVNKGAGTVTIQPTGGVTLNGGNLTIPQFAAVQIVKLDTNTWGQLDSVGTAPGLVPVTPTSLAVSGGSSSLSGYTATFTGVSAAAVNGVFTSTYTSYYIHWVPTAITGAPTDIGIRLRASGTDNTSNNYRRQRTASVGTTVVGSDDTSTGWLIGNSTGGTGFRWLTFTLNRPFLTTNTEILSHSSVEQGAALINIMGVGFHNVSSSFDGFTVYLVGGTSPTFTGSVRVYGYKD